MHPFKLALLLPLVLPSIVAGCGGDDTPDPLFCGEDGQRCDRPETEGFDFCDIDKLYGASREFECVARPDPDACNRLEPCTDPLKSHCTDTSTVPTTEQGLCVQCLEDEHCPGATCNTETSLCENFSCAPGAEGDALCAAANANTPYCVTADTCGECLESADCQDAATPVCNTQTFACQAGCTAHEDCDSGACDFETAQCEDEGDILYVKTTGSNSGGCGDRGSECATIELALGEVTGSRNIVVVAAGDYGQALAISSGTITVIGEEGAKVTPNLSGSPTVALDVSGSANVTFDGLSIAPVSIDNDDDAVLCRQGATLSLARLTVSGAEDIGIVADNCTLTIEQSTVSGNTGIGVSASGGGTLTIEQSTVSGNTGGGVDVNDSNFNITNTFIIRNGSPTSAKAGVTILNPPATEQLFNFNTIAGNRVGPLTDATNLDCRVTTPFVASGNIVYQGFTENSQPSLSSTNCGVEFSNVEGSAPGSGNIDSNPMFANPIAGTNGDYHLASGSPCIDAANPAATIDVDIDGDTRPLGAGPDMGADEVE